MSQSRASFARLRRRIVIAHSLSKVAAYEALWTTPDHSIDLFITPGSPLGLDGVIVDRLRSAPAPAPERCI